MRPAALASATVNGFSIRSFGSWGEARFPGAGTPHDARFSIRSFGSWGEAYKIAINQLSLDQSFSIRSFGSWGEAVAGAESSVAQNSFQYPLFRIVG